MKARYIRVAATPLAVALLFIGSSKVLGAESDLQTGDTTPKDVGKVIVPPDVSKQELKRLNKLAVLVTSTSPLFGQVANDLLAVKLRDKGFDVVEQTKLSETTMKEWNRLLQLAQPPVEAPTNAEAGVKESARPEKPEAKEERKPQEETLNVLRIGKELGLDAIVVGTLFEGRRQMNFTEDKLQRFMDKIVVATFYLQVIDVQTEKVVLAAILEYDKGGSIGTATDALAKALADQMKR